jgi:hypothetical protein
MGTCQFSESPQTNHLQAADFSIETVSALFILQEEHIISSGLGAQLARPPVKLKKEKVNVGQ